MKYLLIILLMSGCTKVSWVSSATSPNNIQPCGASNNLSVCIVPQQPGLEVTVKW